MARRTYTSRMHTFVRAWIHLVWTTAKRAALIDHKVEKIVRDAIARQAERLACPLEAFGANDDHVHVVVQQDKATSLVVLVRALKGASARAVGVHEPARVFRWQEGYGAFSVSERDPSGVVAYVVE